VSAAPRVPSNTESTKNAHFKALAGSSFAVVGGAIAAAIAFTIGASQHNVLVMLGGPVAVALLVLVISYAMADSQAEDDFFESFAKAHGLWHASKYGVPELTPLLGGGDRRHCEHWMMGDTRSVGWFTFEIRHENGDKPDTWEPQKFTVAMDDLGELGMARFRGIYLRRRRGVFDRLDTDANWLRRHHLKKVELESTAFCERYELWVEEDQDDIVVRQLFAPSFVVWLAEHPLQPGFEVRAGTLVVFIPGHCGEAGKLEFLLMAEAEIAKRIRAELTEAAQAAGPR
jgi:hypothetical protein